MTAPEQRSVAVVTGAASGIGRATALALVEAGWHVVAVDRDAAGLADLPAADRIEAVCGDVTDRATLTAAADRAESTGRLRGWVNNAAVVSLAPLHEVTDADIDAALAVNLRAYVVGAQVAVRSFLAHAVAGAIVNVSSVHAEHSFPGYALYDTSKGGINALTRYLCVEYGRHGIRANAVAPGVVLTPSSLRLNALTPDPEADLRASADLAPARRSSGPEEIAAVVAFLLGEQAVAVNGHVLAADNGMAAWTAPVGGERP